MHHGEVWWANLPLPAGKQPVLLLSRDTAYQVRTSITVAAITRTIRHIPVEVALDVSDGMPEKCVVNLDDIMTIPKSLLSERITMPHRNKMALVGRAISFALNLERQG